VQAIVDEIGKIESEPDRMRRQTRAARMLALLDRAAARLSHMNRT
jgi:hypothetical protein